MSVRQLNFRPASAPVVAAAAETRPQAELWLNIGVTIPMPQADGTTVDTFVSLPVGLPLDTAEPMTARGNNPEWLQMVQAKNWLLKELQTAATELKPGEETILEGIEIQLKRVGHAEAPKEKDNAFLALMKERIGKKS